MMESIPQYGHIAVPLRSQSLSAMIQFLILSGVKILPQWKHPHIGSFFNCSMWLLEKSWAFM